MRAHPWVTSLEPAWRVRLEALAKRRGWPISDEAVADGVRRLSDAYNGQGRAPGDLDPAVQAARLLFFLPRDTPKSAGAVRDWIGRAPDRPLRILDLGAGLGATSLGVVRAWRASGHVAPVSVVAADAEPSAAELIREVLRGDAEIRSTHADARTLASDGGFDLVLLGQVICELDRRLPEDDRADAHAAWIAELRATVKPGGAVVVVEPALRDGTRHLMRVRDRLVGRGLSPYAPCTHDAPCPMLPRATDWCHEWLAVDLPAWLQPVARAAGLRWEGLSYARLVLADDPRPLGRFRATSDLLPSKGRSDVWLCGEGAWRKVGRQDRHRAAENAAFDDISRGDMVDMAGEGCEPGAPKPAVRAATVVRIADPIRRD